MTCTAASGQDLYFALGQSQSQNVEAEANVMRSGPIFLCRVRPRCRRQNVGLDLASMSNVWPRPQPRGHGQRFDLGRGHHVEAKDLIRGRGRGQYFSLSRVQNAEAKIAQRRDRAGILHDKAFFQHSPSRRVLFAGTVLSKPPVNTGRLDHTSTARVNKW